MKQKHHQIKIAVSISLFLIGVFVLPNFAKADYDYFAQQTTDSSVIGSDGFAVSIPLLANNEIEGFTFSVNMALSATYLLQIENASDATIVGSGSMFFPGGGGKIKVTIYLKNGYIVPSNKNIVFVITNGVGNAIYGTTPNSLTNGCFFTSTSNNPWDCSSGSSNDTPAFSAFGYFDGAPISINGGSGGSPNGSGIAAANACAGVASGSFFIATLNKATCVIQNAIIGSAQYLFVPASGSTFVFQSVFQTVASRSPFQQVYDVSHIFTDLSQTGSASGLPLIQIDTYMNSLGASISPITLMSVALLQQYVPNNVYNLFQLGMKIVIWMSLIVAIWKKSHKII